MIYGRFKRIFKGYETFSDGQRWMIKDGLITIYFYPTKNVVHVRGAARFRGTVRDIKTILQGDLSPLRKAPRQHKLNNSQTKREKLYKTNQHCYLCNKYLDYSEATVDHIIPVAFGGTHDDDNLAICCEPCNTEKRDKHPHMVCRDEL